MRQMTFSHISQKGVQLTHTEENKKGMKMIGPWRGWSVSEPPKGAYHIVSRAATVAPSPAPRRKQRLQPRTTATSYITLRYSSLTFTPWCKRHARASLVHAHT